jgi:hypothetical protein
MYLFKFSRDAFFKDKTLEKILIIEEVMKLLLDREQSIKSNNFNKNSNRAFEIKSKNYENSEFNQSDNKSKEKNWDRDREERQTRNNCNIRHLVKNCWFLHLDKEIDAFRTRYLTNETRKQVVNNYKEKKKNQFNKKSVTSVLSIKSISEKTKNNR